MPILQIRELDFQPLEYRSALSQVEPSLERPQPKLLAVRTSIRLRPSLIRDGTLARIAG